MMLILLFFIISIICGFLASKWIDAWSGWRELAGFITAIVSAISGIVCIIAIIICIIVRINIPGDIVAYQERYESLCYQAQNNLYDNDNDFGKKELANEIREYNEEIVRGKALSKNVWINLYYPHEIYDNLETIPYNLLN